MTPEELKQIIISEGDYYDWIDPETGYECCWRRVGKFGDLCGYVRVPTSHPWYNYNGDLYGVESMDVHGGITFYGFMDFVQDDTNTPDPNNRKGYWIGFDCAHAGDLLPRSFFDHGYGRIFGDYETYKTKEYVMKECKTLAKNLKKLDKGTHVPRPLSEALNDLPK